MVGFYDSGVGGLTILKEVLELQPDFEYIYLADTESLPLGDKTIHYIQNRVKECCSKLFDMGCDLVILACNTASVNSIRHIQQVWLKDNYNGKQVLSITKPLMEMLQEKYTYLQTKSGLILSTVATHNSGFYQYELIKDGFVNCQSVPLSGLADAIEKYDTDGIQNLLLNQIKSQNINPQLVEYIVLACTHYKWAMPEIQNIFPRAIIVEPSQNVAVKLLDYLLKHSEYHSKAYEQSKFIVTGENKTFHNFLNKLELLKSTNATT